MIDGRAARLSVSGLALAACVVACEAAPEFQFNPPAHTFTAESVRVNDSATNVLIARVDSAFFTSSAAPLHPYLGRVFVATDYGASGEVGILSNAYWMERFGSDPAVIGSTVQVDSTAVTIVGVMAPGVDQPPGVALWIARD